MIVVRNRWFRCLKVRFPGEVKQRLCLAELMPMEGAKPAHVPGVTLWRVDQAVPRVPVLYEPCLVFVLQGSKRGFLNKRSFVYGPGTYLVLTAPLPFECETTASPEAPVVEHARRSGEWEAASGSLRDQPMPDELRCALEKDPESQAWFEGLAPSHRRQYLGWIHEAKRTETRLRRIARTLEMIRNRVKPGI